MFALKKVFSRIPRGEGVSHLCSQSQKCSLAEKQRLDGILPLSKLIYVLSYVYLPRDDLAKMWHTEKLHSCSVALRVDADSQGKVKGI